MLREVIKTSLTPNHRPFGQNCEIQKWLEIASAPKFVSNNTVYIIINDSNIRGGVNTFCQVYVFPKKNLNHRTDMVRIVSVESDEEAEEVTDRHDQLKELVEGQNLKKVRENEHCFNLTIAVFKGLRHTFLQNHWSLLAKYQL